jgi:CMP-N-acetylneuraminic acid synthetase
MKTLVAIVPARRADHHLPGKNVLPFGGTTLLAHKIRQLRRVARVEEVLVTSEDPDYLALARDEGATPWPRPEEFARLDADFGAFVRHVAGGVEAMHILWASPTSPLVDEADYASAIARYFHCLGEGYDSLVSVKEVKRNLLDDNGPLTFRFAPSTRHGPRVKRLFEFTNGVVLAPARAMVAWRYNWGPTPYKLELDPAKSVNICDAIDYEIACFLHARAQGRP